jgi:hypothetical protein
MPVLNLYIICRIIEIISVFAVSNSVPSPKYPIFELKSFQKTVNQEVFSKIFDKAQESAGEQIHNRA